MPDSGRHLQRFGDDLPGSSVPGALHFAPAGTLEHPTFALDLPEAASVRVTLFDPEGRQVATLFDGELAATRRHFAIEAAGRRLTSGVYFARAVVYAGGRTTARSARAVLVR